jgi:hypothetical protein
MQALVLEGEARRGSNSFDSEGIDEDGSIVDEHGERFAV